MRLKHLEKSIYEAPIVKKGEYDYVIHPITDGVPCITPELLKEVSDEMKKHITQEIEHKFYTAEGCETVGFIWIPECWLVLVWLTIFLRWAVPLPARPARSSDHLVFPFLLHTSPPFHTGLHYFKPVRL